MFTFSRSSFATVGVLAVIGLAGRPGDCAIVCYDEIAYPVVSKIEVFDDHVRLVLGGRSLSDRSQEHPVVRHTLQGHILQRGWALDPPVRCVHDSDPGCYRDDKRCAERIPKILLSPDDLTELRPQHAFDGLSQESIDQSVGGCVESGSNLWFGIRFYSGEGITGVGGFGRVYGDSGSVEIRRPIEVRDHSVNRVAFDGETLYVATVGHFECLGDPPAAGLLAYRWKDEQIAQVPTCGKRVHDLQLVGTALWVATDMGLSIGTLEPDRESGSVRRLWKHYEPRPELAEVMLEATCDEIYARVLEAPRRFSGAHSYLDSTQQLSAAGYGRGWFRSDLIDVNVPAQDLTGRSLIGAILDGADLRGANLSGADLRGARLAGAQLSEANVSTADLKGADLSGGRFVGSNLAGADLRNTSAEDASFAGANLLGADLREARLYGVDLSGARLDAGPSNELRISQSQLDVACGDSSTEVPEILEPPPPCTHRKAGRELLQRLLSDHMRWLQTDGRKGKRADLRGLVLPTAADLEGAVLRHAVLRHAGGFKANLRAADLRGADLRWAHLNDANMLGADLREARLQGAELRGADLIGALLSGNDLEEADFSHARLTGVVLRGLNLREARLAEAHLERADLEGANLTGAEAARAVFTHVNLRGARLVGADLSFIQAQRASLTGAVLAGANLNQASLVGADLTGADMSGASLQHADLAQARLLGARLDGSNFSHASLGRADLRRANLSHSLLERTDLEWADLTEVSLEGASLQGARLKGAHFDGARLSGADLSGASGLLTEQLAHACGDAYTRLPPDVLAPPACTER